MRVVYIVEEYDSAILVTTNKNTACFYWWNERRKVEGRRPDIYEWRLGKFGAYRHLGDEEVQGYINAALARSDEKPP